MHVSSNKLIMFLAFFLFGTFIFWGFHRTTNFSQHNVETASFEREPDPILSEPKVKEKLEHAWNDIKAEFEIDESEYVQLLMANKQDFREGKLGDFKGKRFREYVLEVIHTRTSQPVGSTYPLILIKKDSSEIIYGYKDVDEKNFIMRISIKDWLIGYSCDVREESTQ